MKSNFKLSTKSLSRLRGLHPDLILVAAHAITLTKFDFGITQGLRSIEEQTKYVEQGKSKTLNSRHLTGHAVDIHTYNEFGKPDNANRYYKAVAYAFKQAAKQLGINIYWGGDYNGWFDGPHFYLSKSEYPA